MGILDAIIELNQYKRIGDLEEKNKYIENNSESVHRHEILLMGLEDKIDQMALLFRTLYDLSINKGLFTKDEFKNMFDKIDLEDGIKNGKLTRNNKVNL
jgi:hypothetical protein